MARPLETLEANQIIDLYSTGKLKELLNCLEGNLRPCWVKFILVLPIKDQGITKRVIRFRMKYKETFKFPFALGNYKFFY